MKINEKIIKLIKSKNYLILLCAYLCFITTYYFIFQKYTLFLMTSISLFLMIIIESFGVNEIKLFLSKCFIPKITRPPGSRLSSIASFLFSKKAYQNQFQNLLADMQHEVFEALKEGRPYKARLEHIKGVVAFWSNVLAYAPIKTFAKLKSFFITG